MKIPYSEIISQKIIVEDLSKSKLFILYRVFLKLYWRFTAWRLIKIIQNSRSEYNVITKDDLISFAEFVLASNNKNTSVSVNKIDTRYILVFVDDKYPDKYSIDTYTDNSSNFAVVESMGEYKYVDREYHSLTTDTALGAVLYNRICNYIIDYLKREDHFDD